MLLLSFVVFLYSMLLSFSLFKIFHFEFPFWFTLSILAKKTHKNCQEYQTAEAVVHGWRVLATNWIQVFWEQLY